MSKQTSVINFFQKCCVLSPNGTAAPSREVVLGGEKAQNLISDVTAGNFWFHHFVPNGLGNLLILAEPQWLHLQIEDNDTHIMRLLWEGKYLAHSKHKTRGFECTMNVQQWQRQALRNCGIFLKLFFGNPGFLSF